jgi:hypothetical protein
MPIVWTDDLKERIKGLWETNSATQIAARLNAEGYAVSRAAISGVVHRMGLSSRNKTEDHPSACNGSRSRPREPRAPRVVDLFAKARALESMFGPTNVRGFDALESHHCRYLVNDDTSDPLWCGRVSLTGKSWCSTHAALVFRPFVEKVAA